MTVIKTKTDPKPKHTANCDYKKFNMCAQLYYTTWQREQLG